MILYKYVVPERIDVLTNGRIRLTQPGLFNDPFESLPYLKSFGSDEQLIEAIGLATEAFDQSEYEKLSEADREGIPFEEFRQFLHDNPTAILDRVRSLERGAMPAERAKLYGVVNNAVGVLSLSERCDNPLMWAHYASAHSGFVIGLDGEHEFFRPERDPDDPLNFLAPVEYTGTRPSVTVADTPISALLLRKSVDWSYEREWRSVRYLQDATAVIPVDGHQCYLFDLPRACVREIILGCRTGRAARDGLLSVINADPGYRNVSVYQAMVDEAEFRLRIVELPPDKRPATPPV